MGNVGCRRMLINKMMFKAGILICRQSSSLVSLKEFDRKLRSGIADIPIATKRGICGQPRI